jgi:hypothetical protein
VITATLPSSFPTITPFSWHRVDAVCLCPFIAAAAEIQGPGHPARAARRLALLLDGASVRSRVLDTETFAIGAGGSL